MRIGGDFEIDVLSFAHKEAGEFSPMPNLCRTWLDTGRSALLLSLEEIIRQGGVKRAVLPAYICPSVIAVFARLGFQIRFYKLDGLEGMPALGAGETFLFAHYFGKTNYSVIEWIRGQRTKRHFFLIEDCVQASMNTSVGETGDFVITSYRKFLPQPDGALLGTRNELRSDCLDEPNEAFVSAKLIGKLLRQSAGDDGIFLDVLNEAEEMLGIFKPRKMSWLSTYMFVRTNFQEVSAARRANWLCLHANLGQTGALNYLRPYINVLADDEIPLGFPVLVKDGHRDRLRSFLAIRQIYCPVHWVLEHLKNYKEEFHNEISLSRSMLTLPIDQRMNEVHVKYLAQSVSDYFRQER